VKLGFLDFARSHRISALHGTGVGLLFESVQRAYRAAVSDLATPELTRLLHDAVEVNQPPLVKGRRVKLRYAHQGGKNPPVIVIHGNQTERLPDPYRRYLINVFRRELNLRGTPVRLQFRTTSNPYADQKQDLTNRQKQRRKRLMKYVRGQEKRRRHK